MSQRPTPKSLATFFEPYRGLLIDLWPVLLATLTILGALGAIFYFGLLGINAVTILTINDYLFFFSLAGLSLALAVGAIVIFFMTMFGMFAVADLLATPLEDFAHRRLSGATQKRIAALANRLRILLSFAPPMALYTVLFLYLFENYQPNFCSSRELSWSCDRHVSALLEAMFWLTTVSTAILAVVFATRSARYLTLLGRSVFALIVFAFTVVGPTVFLASIPRGPVRLAIGTERLCERAALIWGGERAIVYVCEGDVRLIYGPENVAVQPAPP